MSNLESRIAKQTCAYNVIVNTVANLQVDEKGRTSRSQALTRLELIESTWRKFELEHDKICESKSDSVKDHVYIKEDLFGKCAEQYATGRAKLLDILEEINSTNPPVGTTFADMSISGPSSHRHALPKITLPTFSGDYVGWRPFCDLFSSMVGNNPDLSSVEKMHYLKTSLTGDAARLISNLAISSENFSKAWDTLVARYENKRLLCNTHIERLFAIKPLHSESAAGIFQLLTSINETLSALRALGAPVEQWDMLLVYLISKRLDPETHKAWEVHQGASSFTASFRELETFLDGRARALENVEARLPSSYSSQTSQFTKSTRATTRSARTYHISQEQPRRIINQSTAVSTPARTNNSSFAQRKCALCAANHYISSCPDYKSKTAHQRREMIIQKSLCFNCLGEHRVTECNSTRRCFQCGYPHHTSIHGARAIGASNATSSSSTSAQSASQSASPSAPPAAVNHVIQQQPEKRTPVLLATARVQIRSAHDELISARLLLDQGSEVSFISERLTQQLHLRRQRTSVPLLGIGAQQSGISRGSVTVTVKPHFKSSVEIPVLAFVLCKLTAKLPSVKTSPNHWSHLNNLVLADPEFTVPGSVDLILGADVYGQIIESDIIKSHPNTLIAQRSVLGWIVSGPVGPENLNQPAQGYHCSIDHDLHELLQRFWLQEEAYTDSPTIRSPEDEECEQHFISNYSRTTTGRYVVRLPLKGNAENLGDSRTPALRMLIGLQQRFARNQELSKEYTAFLDEYESLGHMKRVPADNSESSRVFYLPHHGVIRESSTTTKLRVVFNHFSRTRNSQSLNDILHTGEKIQVDISDVLMWFRRFAYVFSTDIEKMYRQIQVHRDDWDLQRILWADSNGNINAYQLTTVTYGTGCAPFLALRSLQQLIADEGHKFPLAISSVTRGRYVDDIFGGADTINECQEIIKQLINLCTAGGFPLQKWISNEITVLSSIPKNLQTTTDSVPIDELPLVRTLGLSWQPASDTFRFSFQKLPPATVTKRSVLSQIAQLFDPLGFLAPVTITAKFSYKSFG